MEHSRDDIRSTITFALLRWDSDIEGWSVFSIGGKPEELRGRTAHYVGKGYEGPWQLIRENEPTLFFQSTGSFFDWLSSLTPPDKE